MRSWFVSVRYNGDPTLTGASEHYYEMNTVVAKQQLCFTSVQETHTISDFLGWQKEGGHSQLKLAREAAVSMCPVPEKKSYQPSAGAAVNNYTN